MGKSVLDILQEGKEEQGKQAAGGRTLADILRPSDPVPPPVTNTQPEQKPVVDTSVPQPGRTVGGTLSDVVVAGTLGGFDAVKMAGGLADWATGGSTTDDSETPSAMQKFQKGVSNIQDKVEDWYSPAQQWAGQKFEERNEGLGEQTGLEKFGTTLKSLGENPSNIGTGTVRTLAPMIAGGIVAKGLGAIPALASRTGQALALGAGEGSMAMGSTAGEIRQETGELTPVNMAQSAFTGVATGVLSTAGAAVARRLGFTDVDAMLAGMAKKADGTKPTWPELIGGIAAGGITEGWFEEAPQSAVEQIVLNQALGKPLMEGVPEAMAEGGALGTIMGGGTNAAMGAKELILNDRYKDNAQNHDKLDKTFGDDPLGSEINTMMQSELNDLENTDMSVDPLVSRAAELSDALMSSPVQSEADRQVRQKALEELYSDPNISDEVRDSLHQSGVFQHLGMAVPGSNIVDAEGPMQQEWEEQRADTEDYLQGNQYEPELPPAIQEKMEAEKRQQQQAEKEAEMPVGSEARDTMWDFADQAEEVQAQDDIKKRRRDFEKMEADNEQAKSDAEWEAQEVSSRVDKQTKNLKKEEDDEVRATKSSIAPQKVAEKTEEELEWEAQEVEARVYNQRKNLKEDDFFAEEVEEVSETKSRGAKPKVAEKTAEEIEFDQQAAASKAYRQSKNLKPEEDIGYEPDLPGSKQARYNELKTASQSRSLNQNEKTELRELSSPEVQKTFDKKVPVNKINPKVDTISKMAVEGGVELAPTPNQIAAENYKTVKTNIDGVKLSIENPAGSTRQGTDPDGKTWKQEMKSHYGRILGSKGFDGDHVDMFVKPGHEGGATHAYVINQHNKDGSFDEHKTVTGVDSEAEAMALYNSNYEPGWTGGKSVTKMPMAQFKKWVMGAGPKRGALNRQRTVDAKKLPKGKGATVGVAGSISPSQGQASKSAPGDSYSQKDTGREARPILSAEVKKAFPGSEIKQHGGDYEVVTPNGTRIFLRTGLGEIVITSQADHAAATADWEGLIGKDAADKMEPGGRFTVIGNDALIEMVTGLDEVGVLNHEAFHAAEMLALNARELKAMERTFGGKEERAEAYRKFVDGTLQSKSKHGNKLLQKIRDFVENIVHKLFPTATSTMRQVQKGKVWKRELDNKGQKGDTGSSRAGTEIKGVNPASDAADRISSSEALGLALSSSQQEQSSPGVSYAIRVDSIVDNKDGTKGAVGIVSRGYGRGKAAVVQFLSRSFSGFGTTKHDKAFVSKWAKVIESVPKATRDSAFKSEFGGNKLKGQPIVHLSKGCGRNAAILSAMESGVIDADGMKDMTSCHGACYKNFDQGAQSGGSIWSSFVGAARRDLKKKPKDRVGDAQTMADFFNGHIGTDLKPMDLKKIGTGKKAKEKPKYTAAKEKYEALPMAKKEEMWLDLEARYPEYYRDWIPQEAQAVIVATPEFVAHKIATMKTKGSDKSPGFMDLVNAPSDFIRGNQQGDWQQEILSESNGVTTWEAYAEAVLSRWEKETGQDRKLFPKKISAVTAAWYVDIPTATLERIAKKYGDHLLLQVTGPIDFQAPEAQLRLQGIKKLHDAGLNPVIRMITDEFNSGGKELNDPKAIEMTVDFIIDNKIKPEQILETPVHYDHPRLGSKETAAETKRIATLVSKGMDEVSAREKVLGKKISSMGEGIQVLWEVQPDEAERRARRYLEHNTTEALKNEGAGSEVDIEIGHNMVGLTHERLAEIGIPAKKLQQLRDLGFTYKMPGKRDGKFYEGVFNNRCCTTGKCLTCGTQCSAKYTDLIAEDNMTKAQEMLEQYGPTDAASMITDAGMVKLDVPMAKFSKGKKGQTGVDQKTIKKELGGIISPNELQALQDNGTLQIVTETQVRKLLGDQYDPNALYKGFIMDGKVYLVDGNIPAGEVVDTLIHELGSHDVIDNMFADKMGELVSIMEEASKQDNKLGRAIREAKARIPSDTKKQHYNSEWLAYYIQDANRGQTLYRKVISYIKEALIKMGFNPKTVRFSPKDLRAIAERGVRAKARKAQEAAKTKATGAAPARASKQAGTWYSRLSKTIEDKLPESSTGENILKSIAQWKKKDSKFAPQYQKNKETGEREIVGYGPLVEELEWSGLEEWLQSSTGKVSKADILDYLQNNGVQVEEVMKSGVDLGDSNMMDDYVQEYKDENPNGWEVEHFDAGGLDVYNIVDKNGEYLEDEHGEREEFQVERNAEAMVDEILEDEYEGMTDLEIAEVLGKDTSVVEGGGTRHENPEYQLPGGENYRELLLTLPGQENMYSTTHYDEDNILAHVRFNDRVDGDGNRVLFLEEVQSDWHQDGRRKGYQSETAQAEPVSVERGEVTGSVLRPERKRQENVVVFSDGYRHEGSAPADATDDQIMRTAAIRRSELGETATRVEGHVKGVGVPDAPFKKSWSMLVMKRMIRHASENGYDRIAWTTGEQQADRYNLSNKLSGIAYVPRANNMWDVDLYDTNDRHLQDYSGKKTEQEVVDLLGKEILKNMQQGAGEQRGSMQKVLKGNDLKVGGQGMVKFYDKMLPSQVGKFIKKFGGKVGAGNVGLGKNIIPYERWIKTQGYDLVDIMDTPLETKLDRDYDHYVNLGGDQTMGNQLGFDITPELRGSAMGTGMPLFRSTRIKELTGKEINSAAFKKWFGKSKIHKGGKPVPFYHGSPTFGLEGDKSFAFDSIQGGTSTGSPLTGLGNFFALDKSDAMGYSRGTGNVRQFAIKVENPLVMKSTDFPAFPTTAEARAFAKRQELNGYDGIYISDEQHLVTFEPQQAKSIEQGTGQFDPTNPDVRYSQDKKKSPAFDKWFKGSKIVDENGDPLLVKHGTKADVGDDFAFDYDKIGENGRSEGAGFYFTTNDRVAGGYGQGGSVLSGYLNIKKPIKYDQKPFTGKKLRDIIKRIADLESKEYEMDIEDGFLSNFGDARYDGIDNVISEAAGMLQDDDTAIDQMGGLIGSGVNPLHVNTAVRDVTGHDGAIAQGFGNEGGDVPIYVAFFPNQFKSADNKGSFSKDDDRIRYSKEERKADNQTIRQTDNLNAELDGEESISSVEYGERLINEIFRKLAKANSPALAKTKFGTEAIEKALGAYRKARAAVMNPRTSAAEKQKFAAQLARKLPDPTSGKLLQSLSNISRVKSPEAQQKRLVGFLDRAHNVLSKHLRKQLIEKIDKKIKPVKSSLSGVKKGRGWKFEDDLSYLRKIVGLDGSNGVDVFTEHALIQARREKLNEKERGTDSQEIIDEIQVQRDQLDSQEILLDTFAALESQTFDELVKASGVLDVIITEGRIPWRAQQEIWKQRNALNRQNAFVDMTGDEDPEIMEESRVRAKEQTITGKLKEALSFTSNMIQSWELMMDKISGSSKEGTLKSWLVTHFGSVTHKATRDYELYQDDTHEEIMDKAQKIFKAKNPAKLAKIFSKLDQPVDNVVYVHGDQPVKLSPLEAAYWYQISKGMDNKVVQDTFERMGVTEETLQQIEKMMSPELKTWADYLVDEFYQDFHTGVNNIYRQMYGIDLDKTENYVPFNRKVHGKAQDTSMDGFLAGSQSGSIKKGWMHARVPSTKAFRIMNINDVLVKHVADMNHFKAWALPTKEINGTFNSPQVQAIIRQTYGRDTAKVIRRFQDKFVKSELENIEDLRFLDKVRGNVTKAMIGANPTVFLKQLSSIPAYMADIPAADWVKYTAEVPLNPKKVARILGRSTMMKQRYKRGFERDVATAMNRGGSDVVSQQKRLGDQLMVMTQLGDKLAIMTGGWAVYRHHLERLKKSGVSHNKAHKAAIMEFEKTTERAQQSGHVKDLGWFQSGTPTMRLFTMFMTSPASYSRQIFTAVRNAKRDPVDSAKRLFVFGVLMPTIFQGIADALLVVDGDDEDREKALTNQARAITLGPLNGLPVIRTMMEGYSQAITGSGFYRGQFTPAMETFETSRKMVGDFSKYLQGGTKRIGSDEYLERSAIGLLHTLGYSFGLPTKPLKRLVTNWLDVAELDLPMRKAEPTDHKVRLALGFSRYAVNE